MKKKRLLIWVLVFAVLVLIPICFFSRRNQISQFNTNLSERIGEQDGSFYNSEQNLFSIPDFTFGHDFADTIKMLDLQDWFTQEKIDTALKDMSNAAGECNVSYGDNDLAFSAFGGKVYTLSFNLSRSLNCYMLDFSANFEEPELVKKPPLSYYAHLNGLSYVDSCAYFDELLAAFTQAYGTPKAQKIESLQNITNQSIKMDSFSGSTYAIWERETQERESILQLYARSYINNFSSDPQVKLSIHICIGQTISDITMDDLNGALLK